MEQSLPQETIDFQTIPSTQENMLWQERFYSEFESETTRGKVLNITSFIDELLIKLVSAFMPNTGHTQHLLFSVNTCLSTIMDRANLLLALSILQKDEFDAIKMITRIRNEFAHRWDQSSFDTDAMNKHIKKMPKHYLADYEGSNQAKFHYVCTCVVEALMARQPYATKLGEQLPINHNNQHAFCINDTINATKLEKIDH